MKERVLRYAGGYLKVRMTGLASERFLNLCMARGITLWELSRSEREALCFFISVKDFRRIGPLVKKAGVHVKITGRFGLPFFLYRNRRRKLYGAGVAAFFLVLFIMSRFIWNISLEGNRRFTDDMLLHYLDSQKIHYGMAKSAIDCDILEESIRSAYPEIIWVSARVSGTRLLIRMKENDVVGTIPKKDETPRNLVAAKAGTVVKMVVRKGKAQVLPGEEVEPGQVLISGEIPILGDGGELLNTHFVRADGDIFVRTRESYTESISKQITERVRTGEVRKGLRLRLGTLELLWMLPKKEDTCWEITGKTRQLVLFGDFYVPVWADWITAREYGIYERNRTQEEAKALGEQLHQAKIQKIMEKGVPIIENNVRIEEKSGCWQVQGSFVLEEPAATGQNISQEKLLNMEQEEESELLDERNRNDN